jgi:energy-converting hydrogenase Eha subunit F
MNIRDALLGALLLLVGLLVGGALQPAQAERTPVTCVQVRQLEPGMVDQAMVAKFMSDQLDAGRTRFQTVPGMSTVICAY